MGVTHTFVRGALFPPVSFRNAHAALVEMRIPPGPTCCQPESPIALVSRILPRRLSVVFCGCVDFRVIYIVASGHSGYFGGNRADVSARTVAAYGF